MTMPAIEPYRLAPITFLTAAVRAELVDLMRLCDGVAIRPLVAEHADRIALLCEQLDRHAEP
jgi:hypothetical protein